MTRGRWRILGRMRTFAALSLVVIACACGHAPVPSYPPLASVPRLATEGAAGVEVSLFHVDYRFNADGSYTSTLHDTYKVLAQEAVESWGEAVARWAPWYQERPSIDATITSADGKSSRLDPHALAESAAYPEAPAMYGDERVLRGPLPNVGVGSVVDERVVMKATRPFVGGAESHSINFQVNVPRAKVELVLDVPESMPLLFEVRDAKVKVSDVRSGGRRVVRITGGPYEAIKSVEDDAPSNVVAWPHVGFTTGTDWASVAKGYAKIVTDKSAGADLEGVVAGIVRPTDGANDKAQKLLAWVRDRVRYIGIEFGESGVVPRTPTETLQHGYGDCKDQAVLLVGLLRAAGIPARVALLDAGFDEDIDTGLPALNVFGHAIVFVPGKDPMWIDPTATRARAGELPAQDQGRYALVADESTTALVRTPSSPAESNTYHELRQITWPDEGGARIVETSSATGSLERILRDSFDGSDDARDKWLKEYVSKTYDSEKPGPLEMEKVGDLSKPFRMVLEAKSSGVANLNLLGASVSTPSAPIFAWVPKSLSQGDERQTPFALQIPYEADLAYEIHPPAGFVLDDDVKLDFSDVRMGPATLTRKVEQRPDGVVVMRLQFVLPKHVWTADEVNAFRKAYAAYGDTNVPILSFEHTGAKLHKARDFVREVAVYKKDIQAHPNAAQPKMRFASALLDLGFGTTARKLADEAVKRAPNDLEMWNFAGYIRCYDVLGRLRQTGWDRAGAIAAFKEAHRIDPTNLYAATQLALAYEHNAGGHRYQPGSDLDEAVKVLDSLDPDKLAAYDKGDWAYNAVFDLLYLGRFAEVRDRIGKLDPKKVPMVPAIVVAGMLGGGVNAALAEATRLTTSGEQRTRVLTGAADIFIALRHYPEASALLAAAASASSDASLRSRVDVIGKTKVHDFAKMPVARPDDVVHKVLALCALRTPTMKHDLEPLVSKRDTDPAGVSYVSAFCDGVGGTPSNVADVPREAIADILASSMDLRDEGSDALGWRVSATTNDSKLSFYVVRETSGYQLRAISLSPADLGCEALGMARAGRKPAAAKWLAWARELLTPAAGDDPLRDPPFMRLWADDKSDVELAAATLCAGRARSDLTASTLNAARAKASPGNRLTIIDQAIAISYISDAHYAELLAAATQLRRDAPTSDVAWWLERSALAGLGRFQKLRDESAARLAQTPNDADRLSDLADAEARLGHFKESRTIGERWIATGNGGARAYNEQAWRGLFVGATAKDLEYALKAVNGAPDEPDYANTLAALDVALGHAADAREQFVKSLDLRKQGEAPNDGDWYVFGRIAEQLGLIDEAKAAYAKVTTGDKTMGDYRSWKLAQMRIQALR